MPPDDVAVVEPVAPEIPIPPAREPELRQESSIAIGPLEDRASELTEEALAEETPAAEVPTVETVPLKPLGSIPQVPPIVPSTVMPPDAQQRITNLEEQVRVEGQRRQQESDAAILGTVVDQLSQQIAKEAAAAYGITLEDALPFARSIAKQQGEIAYRQYQAEQFRTGQINAAFAIGREQGVDPQMLLDLPSPEAMIEAATQAKARQGKDARIAALEAENAALKKGRVPTQRMDSGAGGGRSNSREAIRDRYLEGVVLTPQEKAILYPDR